MSPKARLSKAGFRGISATSDLIQLRDLLRQLRSFDEGHLSGSVWLYNSPLPAFAAKHLQPLDQAIIQTLLHKASTYRQKHHYAKSKKLYKTLLADYAGTELPPKVVDEG